LEWELGWKWEKFGRNWGGGRRGLSRNWVEVGEVEVESNNIQYLWRKLNHYIFTHGSNLSSDGKRKLRNFWLF